jgi:hypothetical protein
MALDVFIPEIWSARLLAHLDKRHVYAKLVNREYEGEIRNVGDTVRINQIGNVTVKDYTKNTAIQAPDTLTGTQLTLTLDQAKYFNFAVDDIEAAQANVKLIDKAMQRAAYALADTTDQYIASLVSQAGITIDNGTGGAIVVDGTNVKAYDLLVDIAVQLEQNNVPAANRWIVVPPWFMGQLLKDDRLMRVDYKNMIATGEIPGIVGLKVFVSNNVPENAGEYSAMAGVPEAIAYAEKVIKMEAYRPDDRFADAVKGLLVYGAKVLLANALAKVLISES